MLTDETREGGFYDYLCARGVSRRSFLKFCGGVAAAMGLSRAMAPQIAEALEIGAETGKLLPVVWIEAASCSGCTESFAQIGEPDVGSIVLDLVSLNYSETLSAGAGHSLERAKDETIEAGGYVLVYEGAVVTGWDGNALRVAGEKGTDTLVKAASNAVAVIAAGSCAVDGGWVAAAPNPSGAMGVQEFLRSQGIGTPVVNIPSCPVNPEALFAVVAQFIVAGTLPALNSKNMPADMFGQTIHDNCPRRGHFENGEFVYKFGTEEEAKGYCLYALGCRGPQTYANCPALRWNQQVSWCVESGAPCCGCAEANPADHAGNWVNSNSPFQASRFKDFRIGDLRVQPAVIAIGVTALVGVCLIAHGFGMKAAGRTKKGGGPVFEKESDYALKHGEAIGTKADGAEKRGDE